MNFEFKGQLIEKYDTIQVSDKFKKREFVLVKTEIVGQQEFTDHVKFQLTQDRCNLIDNYAVGNELNVFFNLRGNRWEKEGKVSYFTNLDVWKIEGATSVNNAPDEIPPIPTEEDDLPF